MEENRVVENEGISFADIWKTIKKYWIGLVAIISACTLLGVLSAFVIIPKEYEGYQNIYYLRNGEEENSGTDSIQASGTYVTAAYELLKMSSVYKKTAEELNTKYNLDYDYKTLVSTIDVSKTNNLIINISYTSKEIKEIPLVINTFTKNSKEFIQEVLKLNFVDGGEITEDDITDVSTSKILVIGASFVIGCVIGLCYEFIANSLDKTIKDKKTIETLYGIKVIGMIPDLSNSKNENKE